MGTKRRGPGSFSDESARHVAGLVERLAVDCVLDVGANQGQWASALRRAGYRGLILSFEPLAAPFERLRAKCEGNPQWNGHCTALGAEEGDLAFHRTRSSDLSSALPPSRYARSRMREGIEVASEERVTVRRLDKLLPELMPDLDTARLFLKMDTQGFDLRVFAGAEGVLPRIVGLQSELSVLPLYEGMPGYLDALAAFAARGYAPTGFFPVTQTTPYGVLCEFDCVMVRHGRLDAPERVSANAPAVTVVVTACGDSTPLRECLRTVRSQAHALRGEVLLVMNADPAVLTEPDRRILQGLCDRLLFEPRAGRSISLNSAVSLSLGTVIAFTYDRAEPEPRWLEALIAPLLAPERPPELVGCGGRVLPRDPGREQPSGFRALEREGKTGFLTRIHDLGPDPIEYGESGDAPIRAMVPPGVNCAYRREVFASYHYDAGLGPNRKSGLCEGEDLLLGRLLVRDGYRLRYCPEARIRYPARDGRMTTTGLRRSYYLHGVASVRVRRGLGKYRTKAQLRRKALSLRLKLLRLGLLSWQLLLPSTRWSWLADFHTHRGELAEVSQARVHD